MTIRKIVSGGQTGVDRAALDAAIENNIPYGGWSPKGRKAEDGIIADKYLLEETFTDDYSERTKLNIRDSDGTLVFVLKTPIEVTDGTNLTIKNAKTTKKPLLIIELSKNISADILSDWIEKNNIKVLNIAGPRESQSPGIYSSSFKFLHEFLSLYSEKKNKKRSL